MTLRWLGPAHVHPDGLRRVLAIPRGAVDATTKVLRIEGQEYRVAAVVDHPDSSVLLFTLWLPRRTPRIGEPTWPIVGAGLDRHPTGRYVGTRLLIDAPMGLLDLPLAWIGLS